jgi:LmbE family N-acetylglucosaminyl deacetylase
VVAPHPDDAELACAGLVQQAERASVCVLTAGDGFGRAAVAWTGHDPPRPGDYLALGRQRIREARVAASVLGVAPGDVAVLGFPDRVLHAVLSSSAPVTSPSTGASSVPYREADAFGCPHTREALLELLAAAVRGAGPDLVAAPWHGDGNPDHRAAAVAVAAVWGGPRWEYVVHAEGGLYPFPPGLLWRRRLSGDGMPGPRVEVDLGPEQEERKLRAILAHRSQVEVLRPWMEAFVARNEVFRVADA